jgi:hypothetical protein
VIDDIDDKAASPAGSVDLDLSFFAEAENPGDLQDVPVG